MIKIIFYVPLLIDTEKTGASRRECRMPYSPEHKCETRQKILESARRLFNKKGFSEVSINEVMENAGLTHGGFYRHFRDKAELYAEAVRWFLCPEAPKPWQRKSREPAAEQRPRGRKDRRRLLLARPFQ